MPFRRPVRPAVLPRPPAQARLPQRALTAAASAVQLDGQSIQSLKITDEAWQKEAWRHYDLCGELRYVANRRGAQLSRVRLYVADVDEQGNIGDETEDEAVAALAETVFGGPAAKAEGMRTLGIQLFVPGESYIVAESTKASEDDRWYVVSPTEIKKESGKVLVKRPRMYGGDWYQVTDKKDLIIRAWTPHPRAYDVADSPTRAVLPVLREIERLTMLALSQIDSRLISAGILLMRQGMDFPHAEDKPGGITGLMEMILEAAKAQLSGAGTAAGLVPILAEVPGDDVANAFAHVKFDTPLQGELKDKLDHAIRRLALGLDAPPEVLLGQGAANHWSAWQIAEDEIKTQVEPTAIRVCDALTTAYLFPALKAIGKDPEKYTLWFDPSPLTVRPNRLEDALKLHALGVLTDRDLAEAGAFDTVATQKEKLEWRVWELVKLQPQLIADPEVQKILGLPAISGGGAPPQATPPEEEVPAIEEDEDPRALPAEPASQESPAQEGEEGFATLLPAAEQVVLRALEVAGKRMLDRNARGRFAEVPAHELHTRVQARDQAHASQLLAGAFTHVPALAQHHGVHPGDLQWLLHGYCAELLTRGFPHGTPLLRETLRRAAQRA